MARRYTGGFLSATEQVTDSNTANGVFTLAEAQEKTALGNFPTGRWTPQRSLRFRNSASAYLSRGASTITSGDAKWTYSCWLKINPSLTTYIVSANGSSSGSRYEQSFVINSSGQFQAYGFSNASGYGWYKFSDQLFRDPSAWYHIVIWFDADNSDSTKRVRTWVNNKELTWGGGTADSGAGGNWSSFRYLNSSSAYIQCIGAGYQGGGAPVYFTDSYMSESYMVPTLLVPPSDFALTDPETGSWIPKKYTGSIPTNGWYLPFDDNTTLTYLGLNKGSGSNYLTYSEQFDHANWSKPAAPVAPTVTANTIANPVDGATTADTLNFSTSDTHPVYQQYTVNTLNGLSVTGSVYLKKNTGTTFYLQVSLFNAGGVLQDGYASITFSADGSTCTATPTNSFMTVGADQLSNGWFRVWARNTNVSGSTSTYIRVSVGQAGGASSIYAFGAQLNFGSYVAPYTTSAASAVVTDLTVNNFSLTNNSTYDSFVDVPGIASVSSRNDVGGVTRGNYAILNALTRPVGGGGAFTVGQCGMQCAMSYIGPDSTIAMSSGKWYWEVSPTGGTNAYNPRIGIVPTNHGTYTGTSVGDGAGTYGYASTGQKGSGGTYTSYGTAYNDSDSHTIGVALDMDNGKIWFSRDGVWQASGDPAAGTNPAYTGISGEYYASVGSGSTGGGLTVQFNFGQRAFAYTPPTGFKTLCTTNLPNPVIKKPSDHFDIKTYTGNGTSLVVGSTVKQTSAIQVSNSLKFKDNNTLPAYLETYPNTTGSQTTWTLSFWAKRGKVNYSTYPWIISADNNSSNADGLRFINTDNIDWIVNGSQVVKTGNVFSNTQLWNHFLFVWDTTQSVGSMRQRIFVNGVRVTNLTVANYVSQNATSKINTASYLHRIGTTATTNRNNFNTEIFDGYLAEWNFIDSAAMSPSDFGQFDANNNWVPKTYTGSYGTTGYYLPFSAPTTFGTSSYSVGFTGQSSQYLSLPDSEAFNFGSGDFTIEAWVNMPAIPGVGTTENCVFSQSVGGAASDSSIYFGAAGQQQASLYITPGTTWTYNATGGYIPAGQWTHIMGVRNGTSLKVYVNGVNTGSTTLPAGYTLGNSTRTPTIGLQQSGSVFYGRISNLRIIKGQAIVTGNFTPYKGNLTNSAIGHTGAGVAGSLTGTCSLLTCQSSTFVDNSSNNFTITNNGSVVSPVVDYPWAKGVFSDRSGNEQHWASFGHAVTAPTVLTYATPGTYTWTAPAGVTSVEVLVVAGGGGSNQGGGGAGGVIYNTSFAVTPSSNYTVTVGAGGATGNNNGSNSVFSTLTAIGGGFGASASAVGSGGSGGGGYYGRRSDGLVFGPTANGTGTAGQGFAGGNYTATGNPPSSSYAVGAGGGGAGGVGFSNSSWSGGHGGPGLAIPITGVIQYFAGGGGGQGGYAAYGGIGGFGGGGTGYGDANTSSGTGGVDGTGGGAGGGSGKNGGCGIVILKYTNAYTYTGTGANAFLNQDNVIDTITDYTDSYGVHGNYATIDTANNNGLTVTNAGTQWIGAAATPRMAYASLPISSGKWYWETVITSSNASGNWGAGVGQADVLPASGTALSNSANGWALLTGSNAGNLTKFNSGNSTTIYSGSVTGNTIGIAVDYDAGKIWFSRNGSWIEGDPTTGSTPSFSNINSYGPIKPYVYGYNTGDAGIINFGQSPFLYTPPTGFKALNTKNLKDVGSYNLPDTFGNFVNTPDLVWTKARTGGAVSPRIYDTVRGPGYSIGTNSTGGSGAETNKGLSEFLPNGFQLYSPNGAAPYGLENGYTYVAWCWNRGKIPGFDIVTYAGNSDNNRMIPHNLGQVPAMYVTKNLNGYNSANSFRDWAVYHKDCPTYTGNSRQGKQPLWMHNTDAASNGVGGFFNVATSSEFGPNQTSYDNVSGQSYIAYLWAEVPGFSKFGSYVGNSAADGPFIYTGFKPRWVMVKAVGTANGTANNTAWTIWDTQRDLFNPTVKELYPYNAVTEGTDSNGIDILSNGFKPRRNSEYHNWTGTTYIYAAFAETPFKYANAR